MATSGSTRSLFPTWDWASCFRRRVILSIGPLTPLAVDAAIGVGPDFMTEDFDAEDEDAIDVAVQFEGDMQALDMASMVNSPGPP